MIWIVQGIALTIGTTIVASCDKESVAVAADLATLDISDSTIISRLTAFSDRIVDFVACPCETSRGKLRGPNCESIISRSQIADSRMRAAIQAHRICYDVTQLKVQLKAK